MKYGICTELGNIQTVKSAGYDYIEPTVTQTVSMSDDEFSKARSALNAADMRAEVCNCFIDADKYCCVGENADLNALNEYFKRAVSRCAQIGTQVIVFGSGRARIIPDGFSEQTAKEQFCNVLQLAGNAGKENDIVIALEPLPSFSTNLINTVEQAIDLVKLVSHPNVSAMADLFHVNASGETYEAIESSDGLIRHVHISKPVDNFFPAENDGYDYISFFKSLRAAGYNERMSIEARSTDLYSDAVTAIKVIKKYETIGDAK